MGREAVAVLAAGLAGRTGADLVVEPQGERDALARHVHLSPCGSTTRSAPVRPASPAASTATGPVATPDRTHRYRRGPRSSPALRRASASAPPPAASSRRPCGREAALYWMSSGFTTIQFLSAVTGRPFAACAVALVFFRERPARHRRQELDRREARGHPVERRDAAGIPGGPAVTGRPFAACAVALVFFISSIWVRYFALRSTQTIQ
jgi:hypothetical protein